jgi:chromosome segregation ATPase
MREWLFPPAIIARALDDLSAIAGAARRLETLEADVLARVDRIETELMRRADGLTAELGALRAELRPIAELPAVRKGIEPLDDDMRAVRESVDELEPLLEKIDGRLAGLADGIERLHRDLAPLGELADKIPGIGR